MNVYLEAERLILRELQLSDVDGMYEMDSDPDVHQYLGKQPVKSKEEVFNVIQFIRQQYIDYGIGRWAMIDKRSNDFIGWAGLKWVTEPINGHVHYYDLGYRLRKNIGVEV
jgi:ribosomal-protein-alanine N-acetyltransferase